jgi:mannose-1-phosphate guanylyltransferase
MPKQFVSLFDELSLFQKTIQRNEKLVQEQLIISNKEQFFIAHDQIIDLGIEASYLLEPVGRNTAPAIALACMAMRKEDVVLVSPSDHLISNEKAYADAVIKAKALAEEGFLVTFGIVPTYPETGFGYIESKGENVLSFKEKPDVRLAKEYIDKGNFYWNSGIFCFTAGSFLGELEKYHHEMYEACLKAYKNCLKDDYIEIKLADMESIPEDSIDYAVMEKSSLVKVVPVDMGWSDLGSFDALYEELPHDDNGNTKSDNAICIDAKNNLLLSEKTIALIDVDDLIIVDTDDALLISKKGSSQKIKTVVNRLKVENSELPNTHLTVYRPWGKYTELESGDGYKIKKIVVNPGKRLSLQKHFHRNEHWVVVSGTAQVSVGENSYLVRPNESTYIKMGETHRLENPGKVPVIMIEVQVGAYTGEDDIVRIEDDFSRC